MYNLQVRETIEAYSMVSLAGIGGGLNLHQSTFSNMRPQPASILAPIRAKTLYDLFIQFLETGGWLFQGM
jgi:hypothetical protein